MSDGALLKLLGKKMEGNYIHFSINYGKRVLIYPMNMECTYEGILNCIMYQSMVSVCIICIFCMGADYTLVSLHLSTFVFLPLFITGED